LKFVIPWTTDLSSGLPWLPPKAIFKGTEHWFTHSLTLKRVNLKCND
jgi:hypothetical protein